MKISAVVLTKNEEENIKVCLKALNFCNEVIVVDDHSTDKTREIIKKLGAKVFTRLLKGDFAAQRNFGLRKTRGDWVLFVDADERVSKALADEIKGAIKKANHRPIEGFFLKRKDFVFGKWLNHGEGGNIRLLRLAKKDAGKWERPVHEIWKIKGKVGTLAFPLLHYPHPSVSGFLERIDLYSTICAKELFQKEERTNFFLIIAYPTAKFVKNFFLNFGFLDGLPGFLHAVFMSFHSFLTRGKLWLLYRARY